MGRKKSRDKRLLVACDMPPLYRTKPGKKYAYVNDDVLGWISKRPGLLMYVFDKLVAAGHIYYDSSTEMWQGVDYEEEPTYE